GLLAVTNAGLELEQRELELDKLVQRDLVSTQRGLRAQMLIPLDAETEALRLAVQAVGVYGPDWSQTPPREAIQALEQVLVNDALIVRDSLTLAGHSAEVYAAAWSADGQLVISASEDGDARVWDAGSGRLRTRWTGHSAAVLSLSPSPVDSRIVTGDRSGVAQVWNAATGEAVAELRGHRGPIWALAWSDDGTQIATGGADGVVQVWSSSSGELQARHERHDAAIESLVWLSASAVAIASADGLGTIWT